MATFQNESGMYPLMYNCSKGYRNFYIQLFGSSYKGIKNLCSSVNKATSSCTSGCVTLNIAPLES